MFCNGQNHSRYIHTFIIHIHFIEDVVDTDTEPTAPPPAKPTTGPSSSAPSTQETPAAVSPVPASSKDPELETKPADQPDQEETALEKDVSLGEPPANVKGDDTTGSSKCLPVKLYRRCHR